VKLEKPSRLPQRIERGLSDVFGTALHDLPETREESPYGQQGCHEKPSLTSWSKRHETAFKSEPLADFKIVHIAARFC